MAPENHKNNRKPKLEPLMVTEHASTWSFDVGNRVASNDDKAGVAVHLCSVRPTVACHRYGEPLPGHEHSTVRFVFVTSVTDPQRNAKRIVSDGFDRYAAGRSAYLYRAPGDPRNRHFKRG